MIADHNNIVVMDIKSDVRESIQMVATLLQSVPVVPVTINGAFEALPAGTILPRPFRKVLVRLIRRFSPKTTPTNPSRIWFRKKSANACRKDRSPN